MFFALFVVVRTKFFVQNKRSFFHRIPLFGPLGCDMCHFSLFPVSEIQNLPDFSCKILQDVQNQLETLLLQWYNNIVILWENQRKAQCGQAASAGIPVGCVRIATAALRYCTCAVLPSDTVRKVYLHDEKDLPPLIFAGLRHYCGNGSTDRLRQR